MKNILILATFMMANIAYAHCPYNDCYDSKTVWTVQCGSVPSPKDPENLSSFINIDASLLTRSQGVSDVDMKGRPDHQAFYQMDLHLDTFNGTLNDHYNLNLSFSTNTEKNNVYAYVGKTPNITSQSISYEVMSPNLPGQRFLLVANLDRGQPGSGIVYQSVNNSTFVPVQRFPSCRMTLGDAVRPVALP